MRTSPRSTRGHLDLWDRAGLWVVMTGSGVVAALHTVGLILSGRQALGDGSREIHDMPIGNARTPEFTEPFPAITEARYESVAITLQGAPSSVRWSLWAADAVASLAVIGVCLALIWLCLRVGRRRPFGRSVTVALGATAVLVTVGGLGQQVLGAIGRAEAVEHIGLEATAGDYGEGIVEGFTGFGLNLSLGPLGIGLAIAVIALAFALGARMQRDTEGLV